MRYFLVGLQGEQKFPNGCYKQMHSTKVWLYVNALSPWCQFQLLIQTHTLVCQVADNIERQNALDVIQVQFKYCGKLQKVGDQPKEVWCIDLCLLRNTQKHVNDAVTWTKVMGLILFVHIERIDSSGIQCNIPNPPLTTISNANLAPDIRTLSTGNQR